MQTVITPTLFPNQQDIHRRTQLLNSEVISVLTEIGGADADAAAYYFRLHRSDVIRVLEMAPAELMSLADTPIPLITPVIYLQGRTLRIADQLAHFARADTAKVPRPAPSTGMRAIIHALLMDYFPKIRDCHRM